MEYQKIIDLLENTPNQPTKFRTKNWVEMNDDACWTRNTNSQMKLKNSILKSSLCDYSGAYILASGTIIVAPQAGDKPNNRDKEVVFETCAVFTVSISEINNTQIGNAKSINVVMSMYNLIRYSNASAIANFSAADGSVSFTFKQKLTSKTATGGT